MNRVLRDLRRRFPAAFGVSLLAHVVAIVALAHLLVMPGALTRILTGRREAIPAERVGFISIPRSPESRQTSGRSGGDGTPETARPVPALVAPREIPTGVPDPAPATDNRPQGTGPLVGSGGPARGIRPEFRDPRLWAGPAEVVAAPRSVRETIDSMIAGDLGPVRDSMVVASGRRRPGDWTFEAGGQKYGVDETFIRLGPVSIPTAVLALLPLNVQSNPTVRDRERALSYMNADISYHARRAISEDEFRRQVRNLRQRRDRERAERGRSGNEKEREASPPAPSDTSRPK